LVTINKTRGDNMAGFDPAKAARMNQLAQQYPNATLSTLATLARVPVSDLGNYTNDSVGTRASNANFGRVTSESSQGVQSSNTARNTVGSGSAFTGTELPPTNATAISSTPRINPFTGRAFETPTTPTVTSPASSQNNTNTTGSAGSQFAFSDTPRPQVTSPSSSQTNTNTTGSAGSQFAFSDVDLPPPSVTTPTPRPSTIGAGLPAGSRGSGEFLDTRGRAPTPQPDPFPAAPPARPAQEQDDDVDFTDAYGDSYTEVTPIPPSTRRPGVEQAQPFQPPQSPPVDYDTDNELPGDDYDQDFRTADDIARANRTDVPTPTPRPDITAPEAPPARPAQEISQVDDFGGTGITEVDDFGGPSRNITPVDDFSGSAVPPQVDDFAEINAPAQVDDFDGYSNNDFGTEDPGLDAFGPGPAPAQVDDFAEYQAPAQVDDFAEINNPAQVDDFADYSDNDFGTEDPGLDAFGPGPEPAQVDDFADYSDNDFGAQVDDFGDPTRNPAQVDDFAEYSDDNFGEEDFSDFATTDSPDEVNPFGVDDFGDAEAAQFDEFGDPIPVAEEVVESNDPIVAEFDEFGDPIDPQVTAAEFDEFGNPIDADGNRTDLVENDGESLVGDDPVADIGDGAEGDGVDGVEQAALSEAQQSAIQAEALKTRAQQQQTISEMREASGVKNADGDWRVKLRLAPQATYLYKAANPGILAPLRDTDGIIFPYTPTIDVQYRAEYQTYSPTHSNYQHYFYKGSSVQTVQLQAEFTAQDTVEAEYLLACIHFLKSASKMFYGQDAQRGSPPPLLYLSGLGEYQFNESPCVVSEFNYNLPQDVNYIRARSRHIDRTDNLQYTKPLATTTTNGNFSALNRLKTAVTNAVNGGPGPELLPGAKPFTPSPGNLGSKGASYVPTKMAMTINLLPIVSRKQVSQQFSLREYANGNLIKKGMW